VGIKMGDQGCLLSDGHESLRLGIYPVPVADTCGAGDAFIAGFIYGKQAGWDLARTATFATATAAFCVTAIGATAGIPDAKTVLRFTEEKTVCRL
jgi:sugar/nucleoside kinase (ribokinase family)